MLRSSPVSGIHTVEPLISGPRSSGFLDYPDFFCGPNFVMNVYLQWSRSVGILFFKIKALKSEVRASLFRFQEAKAALARVVTNEVNWIEV